MIVSWNWLQDYVRLDVTPAELAARLSMSGLNHEETKPFGPDYAIDLEVTSNRPDCLGHIGIAREIAVLLDERLQVKNPQPRAADQPVSKLASVTVEAPELCPRYTARVIRGAKIGASPGWLVERLGAIGLKPVNNIVDITNYVLMECGQPLHAFDFDKLHGQKMVVREARDGEQITAIDHKVYTLQKGMCVIADADRPVALGGIMGGFDTEVSPGTKNLLIEAAEFAPRVIRNAARALRLHSPSSYRFERGIDPNGVDWASRRCCELILQLAGGELCEGVIDVAAPRTARGTIRLRYDQLPRILGITIPARAVLHILGSLGCEILDADDHALACKAPSWRRDLSREIDLIEEVARIYGYDKIPEDVSVPMHPSHRSDADRLLSSVRQVLVAAGFDEAITISAVSDEWSQAFSPWTDAEPLRCGTPVLKGADVLRRSLIPSLLATRAINEAVANEAIELFETSRIYLPQAQGLPQERWVLGLTSGRDIPIVKGVLESLLDVLHVPASLSVAPLSHDLFAAGTGCRLQVGGQLLGFCGTTSEKANKVFGVRESSTIAEIDLNVLQQQAVVVPQYQPLVPYPATSQDLNLILDEAVTWAQLADVVRRHGGDVLEQVRYRETYRNPDVDGRNTKRILLTIVLRSKIGTLTTEQANAVRDGIVSAVAGQLGGKLLG